MNNAFDISKISFEMLNSLRKITDPLADGTVSEIISSGYEKQINQVFLTLVTNDGISSDTFSAFDSALRNIIESYFAESGKLPDWYDKEQIQKGEEVFNRYGPEIFMLLNVSSLPMCYTCAKGAEVLFKTGRLMSHNKDIDPLARRLMETAQMIMNVMTSGGLSPTGSGVVTIQKVRLIHASIRYYLKKHAWDSEALGEPINQEDLAGTLMSFGPVILSGLRHLNVELSSEEEQSYMHCWKVVGYLMGIDHQLLPNSYDEGFSLATTILKHQAAPSQAGKELTASCIQFLNYVIPGNAFNDMPSYMMSYFLQDFSTASNIDLSACIGVNSKEEKRDKVILAMTKYIIGKISHLEHSELIRKVTPIFNKMLLQGMIHHFNGGKAAHFSIPPSLKTDWGLTEEWKNHAAITPNIIGNRFVWQKKKEIIK